MPDFAITPADSPDFQCNFTVPRKGKTDIVFSVPRVEYTANFDIRWQTWLGTRMAPKKDANGKSVDPKPISDSEAIVEQLRLAGDLSAATVKQLYSLTLGELTQIFSLWTEQSKVTVGESAASDS